MAGVAESLSALRQDITTSLYVYSATATPDELDALPAEMRTGYLNGLAAFDTIGLSSERWRRHLGDCFERWRIPLPVLYVEEPGPDLRSLHIAAEAPETALQYEWLRRKVAGRTLISQSGRADPIKGTLASLDAFESLIRSTPSVRDNVIFALFVHSTFRDHQIYSAYEQAIRRRVAEINGRYGSRRWQPVLYRTDLNYHRHIALLQRTDVRLDNSARDGMLLIEHPFVTDRSAAEALSIHTGSFDQLGNVCLPTDPFDGEKTVGALAIALEMDESERRRRVNMIRQRHYRGGPAAFEAAQLTHALAVTKKHPGRDTPSLAPSCAQQTRR
jgi:trehalose-6-phosphate synthase